MTIDDEVLTVQEVADRLRVSPWMVRSWLRSGQLRGVRLGGTKSGWRIEAGEVRRFWEDLKARSHAPAEQTAS